ncbi:MAG: tRNA (guanosine(37)-N1)-methyltransferase TrmD [Bacteroidetes bacterium]|nr:tRNA (guanosine(37)-N1)-methyltransferase TrmD [Bacteroidota bacterium]HET6245290.1 tRNA (guanosine(37)-N1)-methyltransferase TrmD [Bacteroidia bacterium]
MRIDILTVLPQLLDSPFSDSIIKRAQSKGLAEIHLHNIRDYSSNKHKTIDDAPYGGSAGMVMMIEPIAKCIEKLQEQRIYDQIIYMTPDGIQLQQSIANKLSSMKNIIILCGHYKGIDQRVRDKYITMEISIGDYVLTGGELAAAVLCDTIIRVIPGVLNDETSALSDSFQDNLLAPPVYTRPADYQGLKVPEILLSGNSKIIDQWRHEQSLKRTLERRPDLLNREKEKKS